MKLRFFILLLLPLVCHAQTGTTIIDELTKESSSGKVVTISGDLQVNALIGKPSMEISSSNETFVKLPGYRIQAFSGNQPQSRSEAESKARNVRNIFPDVPTYVIYKAPIWRLRIGDFLTNEEATNFMRELKKKLPSLGKEMYVAPDEIKIIL